MKTLIIFSLISFSLTASEEVALKKIKHFSKTLQTELKKGLEKSAQEAVKVCNIKAPEIAQQVSTKDIKIGRVSIKNRNPDNYPQDWMLNYIQDFKKNKIDKSHIIVKLKNGKSGLLKPIHTMPLCLNCHGENISAELHEVIKQKYPNDKATGYKVGEIRGFFWAEY